MTTTTLMSSTLEPMLPFVLAAFMIYHVLAKLVAIMYLIRDIMYLIRDVAVIGTAFLCLARILGWEAALIRAIKKLKHLFMGLKLYLKGTSSQASHLNCKSYIHDVASHPSFPQLC